MPTSRWFRVWIELPRLFQVRQKVDDDGLGDVGDEQPGRRLAPLPGHELQEQLEPVPVALDGVARHVPPAGQVVLEEGADVGGQEGRGRHRDTSSLNRLLAYREKRSFASRSSSAVAVR